MFLFFKFLICFFVCDTDMLLMMTPDFFSSIFVYRAKHKLKKGGLPEVDTRKHKKGG